MTSTLKRTQRDYSLAFKLAVVDQIEEVVNVLKRDYGVQVAKKPYGKSFKRKR